MFVDDNDVAIQCHEDHEEDAAVETHHEETGYGVTRQCPKNPLVHGTVSPDGERDEKEQVRDGQVEQTHVCQTASVTGSDQDPQDQSVSQQANDQNGAVQDGKQHLAEGLCVHISA